MKLSQHMRIASKRERRRLKRIRNKKRFKKRNFEAMNRALSLVPMKFVPEMGRKVHLLAAPKKINLSNEYVETIEFLEKVSKLTKQLHGKFRVDLTTVEEITPAGALVLVAAFDRWKSVLAAKRLRAISLEKWNPSVRRKLREMGFFEVLGSDCYIHDEAQPGDDQYLPFLTGSGSDGEQAKQLRKMIESLGPQLEDSSALYDGLVEAMTNVKHHAYDSNYPVKKWWMSASVNVQKNKLTVIFLDHGISIPATLPRSKIWEQVRGFLTKFGVDSFQDDARLIEAALSVEKSRTGDDFRGNGLKQDIRGYIDSHQAKGRLRILSRNGRCIYQKVSGSEEEMIVQKLPLPMRGTFLEWQIEEYSGNEHKTN